VARHHEEDALAHALARESPYAAEALAERQHLRCVPDADRVLGEAGDLLRPGSGAGRDHEVLVRQGLHVREVNAPRRGVDALDVTGRAPDALAHQPVGGVDGRCDGIRAERQVDEIRAEHELVPVGDDVEIDAT
jgi:hypothetical protein